jgi:hypothetical protein
MFVLSSFFISLSPSFSFYHCLWFFVSLYWKKTFFTLLFFLCLYIRASRMYEISLSLKLCCFVFLSVYLNLVFLCLPTFFYWPRPDDNCISWLMKMKLKLSGQSPKITNCPSKFYTPDHKRYRRPKITKQIKNNFRFFFHFFFTFFAFFCFFAYLLDSRSISRYRINSFRRNKRKL